jgi:hypothetical protein
MVMMPYISKGRAEQDHEGEGDGDALAFFHEFTGFADLQEL